MPSVIAELHFEGARVVSVADGLDSEDEEATLGIQIRGIFNELQLRDLEKKTLRGPMGQKERGFSAGERTFGYRSVPVGTIRMDKSGPATWPAPHSTLWRCSEPLRPSTARKTVRVLCDHGRGCGRGRGRGRSARRAIPRPGFHGGRALRAASPLRYGAPPLPAGPSRPHPSPPRQSACFSQPHSRLDAGRTSGGRRPINLRIGRPTML